jgi:hypothetical protein
MCYRGPFSHDHVQLTDAHSFHLGPLPGDPETNYDPSPHLKFAVGEEKVLAAEAAFRAKAANRNIAQFKI